MKIYQFFIIAATIFTCINCTSNKNGNKVKWVNVHFPDEYVKFDGNNVETFVTISAFSEKSNHGDKLAQTTAEFNIIRSINETEEFFVYILKNKRNSSYRILPVTRSGKYLARINLYIFNKYRCNSETCIDSILTTNEEIKELEGGSIFRIE